MPKRTPEYMAAQRERILEAALDCFAEKGFHQTSTDDIARVAGCGKSAIYAHFESKRAMIEALSEREIDLFEARMPSDMTQLEQYVTQSFANLETPRMRQFSRITLHMAAESLSDPDLLDWDKRLFKRYIGWIEPLIRNDPAAADLSERQITDAARRLVFFWGGQALYKMLLPGLSVALLHGDMAAVAPAIIESARRAPPNRTRRKAPAKRPAVTRRQSAAGRQTPDTRRRARSNSAQR